MTKEEGTRLSRAHLGGVLHFLEGLVEHCEGLLRLRVRTLVGMHQQRHFPVPLLDFGRGTVRLHP